MPAPTGSPPFVPSPCQVTVSNNFDTFGSITLASIANLTPVQLQSIFQPNGSFADMTAWFQTAFEMKACGTKVNGLYDWLMSSRKDVKGLLSVQKLDRGPSLLFPFILARQDSVVNVDEYWAISAGYANSGYTAGVTGPLTDADKALGAAGDRVIRVISRYGVSLDAKWFLSRDRIYHINTYSGTTAFGQWKVLASEVATDLSYIDVLITSENAGSATTFDPAPAAGVVMAGSNLVHDAESFCANRPTVDPRRRVPFWIRTTRRVRQVDSQYKDYFKRMMESNEYFRNFGDLPLAERNRQDEQIFQSRMVNEMFFGKAISANQTMANFTSLRQILTVHGTNTDPGLSGKLVAYEAGMIGIMEQLRACGQVLDLNNTVINLYDFLGICYQVRRARQSQGKSGKRIDVYMDSISAANFETAFVNYLKQEFGDIVRINIETGTNELGFSWSVYKPKWPAGLEIAVISNDTFDDWLTAAQTENIASAGRYIMILELGKPGGANGGSIYPGTIASNRKQRTLGELENLAKIDPTFACTMEFMTDDISLVSETGTMICECPRNNFIATGVGAGVPDTAKGYTGPDAGPYGNIY